MSGFMLVEKPTQDMEDVDPGGNTPPPKHPRCRVPSFLHSSKRGLPPGPRPRDRFVRDLGRRPVLLWTAHPAAVAAAAPGESPAPPGGE